MQRRIYGLETEYGTLHASTLRHKAASVDEIGRFMFTGIRREPGQSSAYLRNGARVYLDVGAHPEYCTPECDSVLDVVAHHRAGDLLLDDFADAAAARLEEVDRPGPIHLFRNNLDGNGNSFGCHENYLMSRTSDAEYTYRRLLPYLVTRQIWSGAGAIIGAGADVHFEIAQRSHLVSEVSAINTTRVRSLINTRDEPHASHEHYRRLHLTFADTNVGDVATFLKLAATGLVLRCIEETDRHWRNLDLDNPVAATHLISCDPDLGARSRLATGGYVRALDVQAYYLEEATKLCERAGATDEERLALRLWEEVLTGLSANLNDLVGTLDWVTKRALLDGVASRHNVSLDSPEVRRTDLAFHDINPKRNLFHRLAAAGKARTVVTADAIQAACTDPPTTTRAAIRGRFIAAAEEKKLSFDADWSKLTLRRLGETWTETFPDPFANASATVEELFA